MKKIIITTLSILIFTNCSSSSDDRDISNDITFIKADVLGSWKVQSQEINGSWQNTSLNTSINLTDDNKFLTSGAANGIPVSGTYIFNNSGIITASTIKNTDNDFEIKIDKDKKNAILDLKRKTTGGLQSFSKFKILKQ